MRKIIYTCITGGYDQLKEPTVVSEGWEYICYSDQPLQSKVWKIKPVNSYSFNPVRLQRKHKIYDRKIFNSADLSIWIDGSIQICCDLNEFVGQMLLRGSQIALMEHPRWQCTYTEAEMCINGGKDAAKVINDQMKKYKEKGFPKDEGMVATGLMIRKHTDEVREFCKSWWRQVSAYSHRDQLSFNYLMWKNPVKYNLFKFDILYNQFKIHKHK